MGKRKVQAKLGLKSVGNKLFPFVKAVSAPIAFLEQISAKDRQTLGSSFSTASTTTQLKIMANITLGRLAGVTPFHKLSDGTILPTAPQTINPSGVLNKWTNAGLIGIAYKVIGGSVNKMSKDMGLGSVVPETAKVGSIAKSVLIGGALGGFFDDPVTSTNQKVSNPQSFPSLTNIPTINSSNYSTTTYNNTSDSVKSSFQ